MPRYVKQMCRLTRTVRHLLKEQAAPTINNLFCAEGRSTLVIVYILPISLDSNSMKA